MPARGSPYPPPSALGASVCIQGLNEVVDAANFVMVRLNDATDRLEVYTRTAGSTTLVAQTAFTVTPGRFTSLRSTCAVPR